jgi:flagellar hook-associated protein 1 FlgK
MSGLLGDILTNSQALQNRSTSLRVIGTNIANVNNTSYARQTVQTSTVSGPGGVSYTFSRITSTRDSILDRQVTEETSQTGAADALAKLYGDIYSLSSESLNGSYGASLKTAQTEGSGITGGLTSFFNAWSAYAASPKGTGNANAVYTAAQELASRLNEADKGLTDLQKTENDKLDSTLKEANDLLSSIAQYNRQIVTMEARNPGSSSALKDERQAAMENLAKIVNYDSQTESNGTVTITLASGDSANPQTLVSGSNAGTLSVAKNAQGGYTGLQATYGSATQSFKASGGSLSVLDPKVTSAAIESVRSQLDAVAGQLIDSVNSIYYATKDGALDTPVENANPLLASIADYNEQIVAMEAEEPGSSTALQAERQTAMDSLAKIVKFDSQAQADGSVTITLATGDSANPQTLVSGATAGTLAARTNADGSFAGLEATFGGATKSLDLNVLNTSVTSGFTFFSGTDAGSIDLTLSSYSQLTAASADDASGGNSVALAMSKLAEKSFSTASGALISGTLTESAATIATDAATNYASASEASSAQSEVLDMVKNSRDTATGTSTDEEMSNLIREQHAFQASARILSTLDNLLDIVTTRLGS